MGQSGNPAKRAVQSTGIIVKADHKRHNQQMGKVAPGKHHWVAIALYNLSDPGAARLNLDTENLMTIEGPGCFKCEAVFSKESEKTACRGSYDE
jgi:hypothetical protein